MSFEWVPELGIGLSVAVDPLTAVLLVLVWVATAVIVTWVVRTRAAETARQAGLLLTFSLAMSLLVSAADLFTLFVAWEITSGLSYLLVGFDRGEEASRAARTTLFVTGLGGVALVTAAVLLHVAVGSVDLDVLLTADVADGRVVAAAWLVLLAAVTKSAQWPFHGWLTGASTAPAAASALLHAATLVIAGVYLLMRLAPAFVGVPGWTATAITLGLTTFVWGHVVAARAVKAKSLLAATTAAQMGVALACAALGTAAGVSAAVALLLVHGAYKAALFLVSGHVKSGVGDKSVAAMWPATARTPVLRAAIVVGALALAGVPPVAGWATKEAAVHALAEHALLAGIAVGVGAALGVVAAARLVGLTPQRVTLPSVPRMRAGAALPLLLLVPAVVLGVWTTPLGAAAADAAAAVVAGEPEKIKLVPSLGTALTISASGLFTGFLLVVAVRRADRPGLLASYVRAPEMIARGIDRGLDGASVVARAVERLPRAGIVGTVAGSSVATLLLLAAPGGIAWSEVPIAGSLREVLAGGVLLLAVVGVLLTRTRLVAALMLGLVGFAMASVFAIRSAPDLVLTQIVVETVIVLAFVGVLRRLRPTHGTPRPRSGGLVPRLVVSLGAAALAGALAIQLATAPAPRPLAEEVLASAEPVGAGTNAVNVVLTDFRALDTAGELSVLFLAAVGILALVRASAGSLLPRVRRSHAVASATPTVTRLAVVVALHLLVVGHDAPGGGFVGGLVLGAGVALHVLGTGRLPAPRITGRPNAVLALGLTIAAGALVAPMLVGLPFADMGATKLSLGLLGEPKLTSALVFDIGVLLVVLGLVLSAVEALVVPPGSSVRPVSSTGPGETGAGLAPVAAGPDATSGDQPALAHGEARP